MRDTSVIVVGSGLAGMTAAYRLAAGGCRVLVLERSGVIGGRTASWNENGMPVESGLHKFLGIYRALPQLLQDVGVDPDSILCWVDEIEIHRPGAPPSSDRDDGLVDSNHAEPLRSRSSERIHARFGAAPYHRPLGTLSGLLGNNRLIPPVSKFRLMRMATNGLLDCAVRPNALDRQSVREYALRFGISDRVMHDLLHTLTTGVLFMPPEQFSAYAAFAPALEAVKRGLTFRVGAFSGGMTEVMMQPIARALSANGGTVRTDAPVDRLLVEDGAVVGVAVGDEPIRAEHVVVATSLRPAQQLISDALPDHPWFRGMLALETLSAVTIQMELNRPALDSDRTNFSPTSMCCFAEQSRTTFTYAPGRLSVILYPPEQFLHMRAEEILQRTVADARLLGIDLAGQVRDYRVIRHPHDFYALRPGAEVLRPTQATPVRGLVLAGDYTKQPFVASMEGAVIAGEQAAAAVRTAIG